jgi:lipopolysaccharide export system permease protein
LSAGWVFGEAGVYPPFIGMWVPNTVMGSIGIFLLIRTANERTVKIDVLISVYLKFRSMFARFTNAGK